MGRGGAAHLLPPSSLTLFPDSTFFPAYSPRRARLVTPRAKAASPLGGMFQY